MFGTINIKLKYIAEKYQTFDVYGKIYILH